MRTDAFAVCSWPSPLPHGSPQFRALSDQLYRSEAYHAPVRAAVCAALRAQPERYAPYVVGEWRDYLEDMARPSTWGDHVTLQVRCWARSERWAQRA